MKTFEFSDRTKFIWSIITGWLFVGLIVLGVALIVVTPFYASGGIITLATLAGLGCIIAGLGGLHG